MASGESLEDIISSMEEVAEGVPSAAVAVALAEKYGLDLPIFQAVDMVLQGKMNAKEAYSLIMDRSLKEED